MCAAKFTQIFCFKYIYLITSLIKMQRLFQMARRLEFLPWCLRIAEPSLCSNLWLGLTQISDLNPAIKGSGFQRWLGQGFKHRHEFAHQVRRAMVVVAKQDRKACLPLEQGGHIHLALWAFKDHQIAFPVTKCLTGFDVIRSLMDGTIRRENKATLMQRPITEQPVNPSKPRCVAAIQSCLSSQQP